MHISDDMMLELFEKYLTLTEVSSVENEQTDIPAFYGKRLGIINGSAWTTLWGYYFGRKYLPGVKLVSIGNEAIQLNFMETYLSNNECPPDENIECFARYAKDLCELGKVDAILITCSTMNRSYPIVKKAVEPYGISVVQIDEPMMEQAVKISKRLLVIATHGPTIKSTFDLLKETALRLGKSDDLECFGVNVEEAFHFLGKGNIKRHNQLIAEAIRQGIKEYHTDCVVLAQISMSVFKLEYPDCEKEFGVRVLTSGEEGFKHISRLLGGYNDSFE